MGLFAVIGPSRKEYRSGEASLRLRYLSTIRSRCHQASSSRSNAGKSGRLSTVRIPLLVTAINLISPQTVAMPPGSAKTKRPSSDLRTGEPAVPPQLPPIAGTSSRRDQRVRDLAGSPRYRADPGAPTRTLAVRAPARERYPRGSWWPGFHRPGLAMHGLARAWAPS